MSRIGIGIDFGTTNTAAAVYDGERVTLVELDAPAQIMPSATYIDSELQTLTGQAAIDRYIADNVGSYRRIGIGGSRRIDADGR